MITVLNGNRIDMLISLISVATEYPVQSLKLLGSEQAYRNLVYALTGEWRTLKPVKCFILSCVPSLERSRTERFAFTKKVLNY